MFHRHPRLAIDSELKHNEVEAGAEEADLNHDAFIEQMIQVREHIAGDYALSKNVDVALWLDYRAFNLIPTQPALILAKITKSPLLSVIKCRS